MTVKSEVGRALWAVLWLLVVPIAYGGERLILAAHHDRGTGAAQGLWVIAAILAFGIRAACARGRQPVGDRLALIVLVGWCAAGALAYLNLNGYHALG
jgi:hypothetical protein